jgi:hypothetical protein
MQAHPSRTHIAGASAFKQAADELATALTYLDVQLWGQPLPRRQPESRHLGSSMKNQKDQTQ